MFETLIIKTAERGQFIDVTTKVTGVIRAADMRNGTVILWVPHTTAGITVNENADPSVCSDILKGLDDVAPANRASYRHAEGNSDSHIKSSLIGPSLTLIVNEGRLVLGTWQAIYFAEFDGPRTRKLIVKLQPDG